MKTVQTKEPFALLLIVQAMRGRSMTLYQTTRAFNEPERIREMSNEELIKLLFDYRQKIAQIRVLIDPVRTEIISRKARGCEVENADLRAIVKRGRGGEILDKKKLKKDLGNNFQKYILRTSEPTITVALMKRKKEGANR